MKKTNFSSDKKRLFNNFLSLSGLQIFTYILPLITLPYLIRTLGIETYGLIVFSQAFIMFFQVFVDYGFNLSATREIAINRNNRKIITEIYSCVMIIKTILVIFSFLVLILVVFFVDKFSGNSELYLFTFLMVLGQAFFPVWYFQGMERMQYITIINIIFRISFAISIFLFVKSENDYLLVPILNGLGVCFGSLYSLWLIKFKFNETLIIPKWSEIYNRFKDSSQFFLSRVAVSLYTTANAFVLGLTVSNTMVGYYSIAEKLYQAIQTLYGPITQALYPYVAKERNVKLYKKILGLVVIFNILGVIFAYFIGEKVFNILFTQEISLETIEIFNIFLIANLMAVPSVMIGYPFLAALGYAKFTNLSVLMTAFYHLLGIIIIVLFYQVTIYNVAILFVTTAMLEFVIRVYGVKKYKLWKIG